MRRLASAVVLVTALCALKTEAQTCSTSITSPLSFGTYTGTQIRSSTPFKITCSGSWYLGLNAGTSSGASGTTRFLTGPGGAELSYQLYQDSAYSVVWGDTYPTNTVSGSGNTSGYIYAQLSASQIKPPGTYTDTVSSSTASFSLTVTIQTSCTISANALSFGQYSRALLKANTTLSVTCSDTTPYNVGLNAGTATGATVTTRKMTGPSGKLLDYSLFSNSGYTTNWGNASGSWVSGTGTGAAQTLTVYGEIPANQDTISGTYTDTITATVNY